jgi:hypothetical protein
LRDVLHLRYKRLGIVSVDVNRLENKLQRQAAAQAYVDALSSGKILINVDESVLRTTEDQKRGWAPIRHRLIASHRLRLCSVNLIAAALSDGRVAVTVNQGSTRSLTVGLFLVKLAQWLDKEEPQWRHRCVLLLDNASYHRSRIT